MKSSLIIDPLERKDYRHPSSPTGENATGGKRKCSPHKLRTVMPPFVRHLFRALFVNSPANLQETAKHFAGESEKRLSFRRLSAAERLHWKPNLITKVLLRLVTELHTPSTLAHRSAGSQRFSTASGKLLSERCLSLPTTILLFKKSPIAFTTSRPVGTAD